MAGEVRTATAVEGWMAADLARPADVRYPTGWPWPGEPHPSCRKAAFRIPPDDDTGAAATTWVVVRAALPHDHHVLSGGEVCPGAAGTLAATPRADLDDRLSGAIAGLARARDRLRAAQRDVDRFETEVAQARALLELSGAPGPGPIAVTPDPAGTDAG
jgi:hypothetical protein